MPAAAGARADVSPLGGSVCAGVWVCFDSAFAMGHHRAGARRAPLRRPRETSGYLPAPTATTSSSVLGRPSGPHARISYFAVAASVTV